VGFPGEEPPDFEDTLDLVKSVRFDNLFSFKYSDRRDVPASRFSNKVEEAEKKVRLARLLELQSSITSEKNKCLIGTTQMVLVEGLSKMGIDQITGHTPCNRIVNISECQVDIGQTIPVKIMDAFSHSLLGESSSMSCGKRSRKEGGALHAA